MTDGHPYGRCDLLRREWRFRYVASAVPYGEVGCAAHDKAIERKSYERGLPAGEAPEGQRGAVCG